MARYLNLKFGNNHGNNIRIRANETTATWQDTCSNGMAYMEQPLQERNKIFLTFSGSGIVEVGISYVDPFYRPNKTEDYAKIVNFNLHMTEVKEIIQYRPLECVQIEHSDGDTTIYEFPIDKNGPIWLAVDLIIGDLKLVIESLLGGAKFHQRKEQNIKYNNRERTSISTIDLYPGSWCFVYRRIFRSEGILINVLPLKDSDTPLLPSYHSLKISYCNDYPIGHFTKDFLSIGDFSLTNNLHYVTTIEQSDFKNEKIHVGLTNGGFLHVRKENSEEDYAVIPHKIDSRFRNTGTFIVFELCKVMIVLSKIEDACLHTCTLGPLNTVSFDSGTSQIRKSRRLTLVEQAIERLESDASTHLPTEHIVGKESDFLLRQSLEHLGRKALDVSTHLWIEKHDPTRLPSEDLGRKESDVTARLQAENLGRKESDVTTRLQAENLGRKESDVTTRLQAENLGRKESDVTTRLQAENLGRKESDVTTPLQAENLGRKDDDATTRLSKEYLGREESDVTSLPSKGYVGRKEPDVTTNLSKEYFGRKESKVATRLLKENLEKKESDVPTNLPVEFFEREDSDVSSSYFLVEDVRKDMSYVSTPCESRSAGRPLPSFTEGSNTNPTENRRRIERIVSSFSTERRSFSIQRTPRSRNKRERFIRNGLSSVQERKPDTLAKTQSGTEAIIRSDAFSFDQGPNNNNAMAISPKKIEECIWKNAPKFVQGLYLFPLCDHLFSKGVLTISKYNEFQEKNKKSRTDANREFMMFLLTGVAKNSELWELIIDAFTITNQKHFISERQN